MAEPVTVNTGTGISVAVDDCGASGVAQLVKFAYSSDGVVTPVTADANGLQTTLGTAIAGERNTSSASGSYLSVKDEWNYTSVPFAGSNVTVSAVPTIIGKVWVNTVLSAHVCAIKDNATTIFSLPASAAATISDATAYSFAEGTRFETSLIVSPNAAATGTIVVQWRPL